MFRSAFFAVCLVSILAVDASALSPHARHAVRPAPRVLIEEGKVLLGNHQRFSAVGTVDRKAIFNAIPAVKTIRKEKLGRTSARYRFLITEANKVFHRTLEKVARQKAVDLIVEDGAVNAAGIEVHDLTDAVIKALN